MATDPDLAKIPTMKNSGTSTRQISARDADDRDPVTEVATRVFGIRYLFPWQRLVVANVLDAVAAARANAMACGASRADDGTSEDIRDEDGESRGRQIVLLPTGAGKSLCFQLPSLLLDGPTLVVYPLLALMADQERRLREAGLDPVIFRGGQDAAERRRCYEKIEGRGSVEPARLIIANPEVLAGEELMSRIAKRGVSHLAIDEAHCVSEWGDSFRPAYLKLGEIVRALKPDACTAFTATASPPVLARISEVLFDGRAHLVRGGADRPNILYRVVPCLSKEGPLVREAQRATRPAVVFCSTRAGTERCARVIGETLRDEDVRFYHAGLSREEKSAVEKWFHGHDRAILCATCAWGMGVDKKNVRTVIHRDPPPTVEAYVQEAGRGGRDGEPAVATLLWSPEDRRRIEAKRPNERLRSLALARFSESGDCRRELLLAELGDPKAGPEAGEERIACTGCDVCDGTDMRESDEGWLLRDFIARNRRRYRAGEAALALAEAGNGLSMKEFGLTLWRTADFTTAAIELIRQGVLRETTRWPAPGKLTIPKPIRAAKGPAPISRFLRPHSRRLLRHPPRVPVSPPPFSGAEGCAWAASDTRRHN